MTMAAIIPYVLFLIALLAYHIWSGERQHKAWKAHVAIHEPKPPKLESVQ